jgi:hypothetical protein
MPNTALYNQTPNFGPNISTPVVTHNTSLPSEREYTELAEAMIPVVGRTPLTELFPEETISERTVRIIQTYEGLPTLFPVVQMGQPDVVLDEDGGYRVERSVDPLFIRRSGYVSHGAINNLVRPGTDNEPYSPAEHISKKIEQMVISHNLTWDVFRARMLAFNGLNFKDPRTNNSVVVSGGIPAYNLVSYDTLSGYKGRNESTLFRSLTQENILNTVGGVAWTDADASIIWTLKRFKRFFKATNKSEITAMYVSPQLLEVIVENNEIRAALNGIVPMKNPGTTAAEYYNSNAILTGGISIDASGQLTAIAGIEIRVVETEYKDPLTGVHKSVWPINKVVLVSEVNSQGQREAIGRTQFCASEESGGAPGVWMRVNTETQIPAAPGMYMQMGNAGLPYLKYPHRVAHLVVAKVEDIKNRIGLLADHQHGYF